jgi:hypothetical protein
MLWVAGWTYKYVAKNLGSWIPKHVAILKFGG